MHPLVRKQSETPFIQKIESEYIARLVPHKNIIIMGAILEFWAKDLSS